MLSTFQRNSTAV